MTDIATDNCSAGGGIRREIKWWCNRTPLRLCFEFFGSLLITTLHHGPEISVSLIIRNKIRSVFPRVTDFAQKPTEHSRSWPIFHCPQFGLGRLTKSFSVVGLTPAQLRKEFGTEEVNHDLQSLRPTHQETTKTISGPIKRQQTIHLVVVVPGSVLISRLASTDDCPVCYYNWSCCRRYKWGENICSVERPIEC